MNTYDEPEDSFDTLNLLEPEAYNLIEDAGASQDLSFDEALAAEEPYDDPLNLLEPEPETVYDALDSYSPDEPLSPIEGTVYEDSQEPTLGNEMWEGSGIGKGFAALGKVGAFSIEQLGHLTGSEKLAAIGQAEGEFWNTKASEWSVPGLDVNPLDQPEVLLNPQFWNYQVGQMVPAMTLGGGAGAVAGKAVGTAVSGFAMSSGESVDTYKEVLKETGNEQEAALAATETLIVNTALESLGLSRILGPAGSLVKRTGVGMVAEGGTEGAQTLISEISKEAHTGLAKGKTVPEIAKGIAEKAPEIAREAAGASIVGAGIGGGISSVSGSPNAALAQKDAASVKETIVNGTAAEVDAYIEEALDPATPSAGGEITKASRIESEGIVAKTPQQQSLPFEEPGSVATQRQLATQRQQEITTKEQPVGVLAPVQEKQEVAGAPVEPKVFGAQEGPLANKPERDWKTTPGKQLEVPQGIAIDDTIKPDEVAERNDGSYSIRKYDAVNKKYLPWETVDKETFEKTLASSGVQKQKNKEILDKRTKENPTLTYDYKDGTYGVQKYNPSSQKYTPVRKVSKGVYDAAIASAGEHPGTAGESQGVAETAKKTPGVLGKAVDTVVKTPGKAVKDTFESVATPISYRLRKVSPKLETVLRKFEYATQQNTAKGLEAVQGFFRKEKGGLNVFTKKTKVPRKSLEEQDLLLKNQDFSGVKDDPKFIELQEEFERVRARAIAAGIPIPEAKGGYFPRVVKDSDGLTDYLNGSGQATKVDSLLSEIDPLRTVNKLRSREIPILNPEMNEYYYPAEEGAKRYIQSINEAIEKKKMLEGSARVEGGGVSIGPQTFGDIIGGGDATEGIDSFIKGIEEEQGKKFSAADRGEIISVLKSRFGFETTTGPTRLYKQGTYGAILANPISGLTNFKDIAMSMYNNGVLNTTKEVAGMPGRLVKKAFGKESDRIKLEDISDHRVLEEYHDLDNGVLGKAVKHAFKFSGFRGMDKEAKEIFLNSKMRQWKKMDTEALSEEITGKVSNPQGVAELIKKGEVSDDVKFLLFDELSNYQPLTRAEMTQTYLDHPGITRGLYTMKTFALREANVMRRESLDLVMSGDPKKMMKGALNGAKLVGFLTAVGVPIDLAKDFLMGKIDDLGELKDSAMENAIDNALSWTVVLNRYGNEDLFEDNGKDLSEKGAKAFKNAMKNVFFPPMPKTVKKVVDYGKPPTGWDVVRDVPVGGKLLEAHLNKSKILYNDRRDLMADFKTAYTKGGEDVNRLHKKRNAYNKAAKEWNKEQGGLESGDKGYRALITTGSLSSNKKRWIKKFKKLKEK